MMKNRTLFWTLVLSAAGISSCEPSYAPPANEPASIVISQREVSVAAAGGLFTLKVSHNVDYEIRSDVNWITQDMTRAETEELNFSVAPNSSTEARTGRLTFLSTDEPLEREVTVTQAGKIPDPSLDLNRNTVSFVAEGGEQNRQTVVVTSNQNWTAGTSADWLTITPASGGASQTGITVRLTAKANNSEANRTSTVTFRAKGIQKSLTVTQEGKIPDPSLDLNRNTVSFVAEGGEQNRKTVVVTSNQNWTAGTSADWLTINPASGGASQTGITVRLTAKSNNSESNRTSTVTFRAKGIQKSLTVTQEGKKAPSVLVETAFGMQLRLVRVEGGTFWMGAQSTDANGKNYDSGAYDSEAPVHRVTLSDYYIGEFEVTQGQWQAVMGSNPSHFKKGDNYPVEEVSWNDIQQFIQKLNQRTGRRYALPTEAQWEYAARGGNKGKGYKYSGSNSVGSVAWYDGNSGEATHPVGTKSSNELGLYDMSGNVWEWCADWYDADYYQDSPSTNPHGPSSGSGRVLRGGSWYFVARLCRVSFRYSNCPGYRDYFNLGFRLALLP